MHETILFQSKLIVFRYILILFQFEFDFKLRQIQSKSCRVNDGFILVFPLERYAFLIGFRNKETGGNQ